MYGYQAIWLCYMGEDAGPARQDVQRDWRPECLLPSAYPQIIPLS